jgi:Holliday junction resolvasome RuvABC ATP-dependent DNA helicase subunit
MENSEDKEERERGNKRSKTPQRSDTYTVSFRVSEGRYLDLVKRAEEQGMSVPQYARSLTYTQLDTMGVSINGEEVLQSISEMREDIAVTLETILTNTLSETPETIQEWIDTHLRRAN